ncbi:MAG: methylthioribulose 1-phosphate dehydratase [Acidobacteria bacterium]|nr:methylthioribulose 1-phosphate dehydratase [Acidobacteriota bacterium]MBV9624319.1 methylthioribulose 1-phosphate dehydratase [Acidobacteriota bacterium]
MASDSREAFLVELGRSCYQRGWALGTSGNFSAVITRTPLVLTITASGLHKGALSAKQFVRVDANGKVLEGHGRPSAETALHLTVARVRQAGAVLHTHSVWSTLVSGFYAESGGVSIAGYEMLKGLDGVTSHTHREWLPIIDNDQNMTRLAAVIERTLADCPAAHGFLLRGHGLYTWGRVEEEAKRHLEILEFLLEVVGRCRLATTSSAS